MTPDDVLHRADAELAAADRLLEVAHVAHRLSVSQEYVRRLIRHRKLQGIRLGSGRWRVRESVLVAYVDACERATRATECN